MLSNNEQFANEEWRPVVGWEGWYEVSDRGRVKRVKTSKGTRSGKILVALQHGRGYPQVALCRNCKPRQFLVHRLVAAAFCGECPKGYTVNHIDGCKTNNTPGNLEYCTRAENVAHAVATGLFAPNLAAGRRSSPLSEDDVSEIKRLSAFHSQDMIAAMYGVAQSTISCIVTRKRWKEVA